MSNAPRFIHLRLHSEYSLLEGAVPVKKLIKLCTDQAIPAVAITDTNNMFAALEFSVLASGAGIQPVEGTGQVQDVTVPERDQMLHGEARPEPLVDGQGEQVGLGLGLDDEGGDAR